MNNRCKTMIILATAVAFLLTFSMAAADKNPAVKKGEITLAEDVKAGNAILKKGRYAVYCDHSDPNRHEMVFTRYGRWALTKDITRVPCGMQALEAENAQSQALWFVSDSGEKVLKEVQIKGETQKHLF